MINYVKASQRPPLNLPATYVLQNICSSALPNKKVICWGAVGIFALVGSYAFIKSANSTANLYFASLSKLNRSSGMTKHGHLLPNIRFKHIRNTISEANLPKQKNGFRDRHPHLKNFPK